MTTTINSALTTGVLLTEASQNPVLVTFTGSVITTGLYAIEDAAPTNTITNNGTLKAAGEGVAMGPGTLTNGSATNTHATITGVYGILIGNGQSTAQVSNFGTIAGEIETSGSRAGHHHQWQLCCYHHQR